MGKCNCVYEPFCSMLNGSDIILPTPCEYRKDSTNFVEAVRGRWVDAEWNNSWQAMTATCSNCHERGEVRVKKNECGETVINSTYCPNCGARMDGDD